MDTNNGRTAEIMLLFSNYPHLKPCIMAFDNAKPNWNQLLLKNEKIFDSSNERWPYEIVLQYAAIKGFHI